MEPTKLASLSSDDLAKKLKIIKSDKIINAVIIGFTIGIVCYSAITNGFGFFTFFPLILTYSIWKNSKNNDLLEQEMIRELNARKSNH